MTSDPVFEKKNRNFRLGFGAVGKIWQIGRPLATVWRRGLRVNIARRPALISPKFIGRKPPRFGRILSPKVAQGFVREQQFPGQNSGFSVDDLERLRYGGGRRLVHYHLSASIQLEERRGRRQRRIFEMVRVRVRHFRK
ncbi:hypothetical protein F511_16668 [Dorcoceras hygrometricum]|uniref:Uncharacterized protein n=1 Tax=Dorcoceras hygrometricum TaxID=472368 RepID=A0A2Z7CP50_9LAMI|nr:hypothetical protein F511_16668 [Dorcoceras hygrometricum]